MFRQKGMSKKELRAPDEFQLFIMSLTRKYGNYWKVALCVLIAVIVIPLVVAGSSYLQKKKQDQSSFAFFELTKKITPLNPEDRIKEIDNFISKFDGTKSSVQAEILKGKILFDLKKFKEAKALYIDALTKTSDKNFKNFFKFNIALCNQLLGNQNEALDGFLALKSQPLFAADATFFMALHYESAKDIPKAKGLYKEIVDNYKNSLYFNVSKLKYELL